jgi:hypothetical protein
MQLEQRIVFWSGTQTSLGGSGRGASAKQRLQGFSESTLGKKVKNALAIPDHFLTNTEDEATSSCKYWTAWELLCQVFCKEAVGRDSINQFGEEQSGSRCHWVS